MSVCTRRLFSLVPFLFLLPLLPLVSHIVSVSPPAPSPPTLPPCLSSLPQVITSAGCFHWNIFLEHLDFSCREAGLLRSWSWFGDGCREGVRGWGKGEYKYVSGNTSEHGGEVESEGIVLPLNQLIKEKSCFFYIEYGSWCLSYIVPQRMH